MKVSVIIPSYNHADYIGEAIRSVFDQTLSDFELIVIDDGSQDHSLDVISSFKDERLRYIAQENRGAHAALNRGLQESRGDYLAILNSDDSYHPHRLEKLVGELEADPGVGLAGSYIQIMDAQGKPLSIKHGYHDCEPWLLEHPERSFRAGSDLRAALLTENYLATTSNYVFSRAWYHQIGDFLPLRYAHDWDFALRVSRQAKLLLAPEALLNYRVHSLNTIRENQAAMVFEIAWVLAVHLPQHFSDPTFLAGASVSQRIEQLLSSLYVYEAEKAFSAMLVQRLDSNPELARELLDPGNPARAAYIRFIQDLLERATPISQTPSGRQLHLPGSGRLRRGLARLRNSLKG